MDSIGLHVARKDRRLKFPTNINTSINVVPSVIPENSPPLRTKASAPTPLDSNRSRSRSIGNQSDDSAIKKVNTSPLHVDTENPPVSHYDL